jgi:hypothetical protein
MTQLRIGDRIVMVSCTHCPAGTVTALTRTRIEVVLDDMPGTRWLLRPESLQIVARKEA